MFLKTPLLLARYKGAILYIIPFVWGASYSDRRDSRQTEVETEVEWWVLGAGAGEFQFRKMKMFWVWRVVMAAQQSEGTWCLNWTLKNGTFRFKTLLSEK